MKRNKQKSEAIVMLCILVLLVVNTAVFTFVWYRFFDKNLYAPFYAKGNYVIIALYTLLYYWAADLYGGFQLRISTPSEIIYSHGIASILTAFFMYIVVWILMRELPNVWLFLGMTAAWILLAAAWAWPAHKLAGRSDPPCRTVIIYDNKSALSRGLSIVKTVDWRFTEAGRIKANCTNDEILELISAKHAEGVMLCGIHSTRRNEILKLCLAHDLLVFVRPGISDTLVASAKQMQVANLPVLLCQKAQPSYAYLAIKRLFDILLSLIALIIISPLMLVIACAIKLNDGGPVLYKQPRYTYDRKVFNVLKFRSMTVNAESDGVARLAAANDQRITKVGKIIRAIRFDELPQLFNILAGDMSIVGPRPERPEIAQEYEKELPEFRLRLQVKAGLTGYAQVYGKYNTTPYDKLQMDLQYIGRQSFLTDLKIMLMTVKILFMKDSTEGVDQGHITADDSD